MLEGTAGRDRAEAIGASERAAVMLSAAAAADRDIWIRLQEGQCERPDQDYE